ncbi:hypothetical protein P168DRAFT_283324 [Aspergillus campestris IBT 28561]|uniref:Uncharacterized protein n=1 Tax=Aspergillus campestris (strain IBT 28561) TaxID=1392248 RepID=A0A2I1CY33_ASPC2|nr:uncharacterized protein P168DRAFT_283324 [Aspergillus campestris IBT 28561]PKY02549.1 hypothetical protein P168DRAFT_283324 [Aspergillus campestris IBT 28561]
MTTSEAVYGRISTFTKDMVALMQLCDLNQRGNRFNWNMDDGDESEKSEEPLIPKEKTLDCPTDVCIICYGLSRRSASNPPHKFPSRRQDALRRYLIDPHLACVHDGISCTWAACGGVPKFTKVTEFLAHAATIHQYDVQIRLQHLPKRPRVICSDTSSVDSSEASLKSNGRSNTETPASSVGFEMENIDPRLLESSTTISTQPPLRRSTRLQS